jgi:hypothetical protein
MCNYNKYLLLFILCSCKPAAKVFNEQTQLNRAFFEQLPPGPHGTMAPIDSIKVYMADLEERVVERDDVPEYKLLNTLSKNDTVPYKVTGGYHHLYLFKVYSARYPLSPMWVYMGTTYLASGTCVNLGPAYYGYLFGNQFNMKWELKVNRKQPQYQLQKKDTTELNIIIDNTDNVIRIKEFIEIDANKIGGNKPVIYNVPVIFNDPDALAFTYQGILK